MPMNCLRNPTHLHLFHCQFRAKKLKIKIYSALLHYEEIVVVEDHMKFGGLYSFIRETGIDATITSISFSNELIGKVGSQNYLNKVGWNLIK